MMAVGRYLLLILSLAGITLSINENFTDEDIARFLDYLHRLNNAVRSKHGVGELSRTQNMDIRASQKLTDWVNLINSNDQRYGVITSTMYFDDNNTTQLNVTKAMEMFSISFELGNFYNYNSEQLTDFADDFTQILWRSTTHIGFSFQWDETRFVVLALYKPRGNIYGQYRSNVFPPMNRFPACDPDIVDLIYKTGPEKFFDNILELHNKYRYNHNVGILERDYHLDEEADEILENSMFTQEMYGLNHRTFRCDNYSKLGDKTIANNVFFVWYNDYIYYTFKDEPTSNDADSFTQIVWGSTLKIGMSMKRISYDKYQVVVIYEPRGNIPGQFASNVFRDPNIDQEEFSDSD